MEQIKIVDKLTLRQEALRMAVARANACEELKNAISLARDYEEYLQGESVLPEYVDTSKMFADVMEKMNERWHQPNPWIPADSEMNPATDTIVLVRCEGYENPQLGKYLGEDYWEVRTETLLQSKLNEVNVVAWCAIPPFTQPTL